jgi:hypothetical protein
MFGYFLLPALAVLLPAALAGGQLLSDDFTAGMQSTWTVVDEGTIAAPSKWWVPSNARLRQESKIRGTAPDPLTQPGTYILAGQAQWKNYSFTTKIKANNLDLDPGAMGIMFGYRDAKNYYRFSMDRKTSKRRLVKVVNGLVTALASDNTPYDLSRFYTVEARMVKGKIEIWVDWQLLFKVADVSHQSGKIALYASDHGGLAVDYVLVTELDPAACTFSITPSQAAVGPFASAGTVAVTAPGGCSWTAASNAPWISIASGAQGTGDGVVAYSVQGNPLPTPRQGTLTIAGLNFAIAQEEAQSSKHVPPGGDLQSAIDKALPGTTITLEPGAEYIGHFVLRTKPGAEYITITTADPSKLPPSGTRILPSYAPGLPKIVTPDHLPAITTEPGAHHYRLIGLEIRPSGKFVYDLIRLGSAAATAISEQARNIIMDRVYLHGNPKGGAKRGISLNSGYTAIRDSYFADFKEVGQDTQAIAGWNGPGPYDIINNYLEAAGENVMFGGATPKIKGVVPSDITIRRNHFYKPLEWCQFSSQWDGSRWTIKNLLELKMARRVTIEGNVFENNWHQAQAGFAIVFTVRSVGIADWAVVEDVSFVRNIVRHSGGGVNILGMDGNWDNMGITRRILIKDNVFEDIDYVDWKGDGRLFQLLNGSQRVTIDHNTVVRSRIKMMMTLDGSPTRDLVYTNNIAPHGEYGVMGSGKSTGNASLAFYAPGAVLEKNILAGGADYAKAYPHSNFFPASFAAVGFAGYYGGNYTLTENSPYSKAGTDDQDLGADIQAVTAATAGVVVP